MPSHWRTKMPMSSFPQEVPSTLISSSQSSPNSSIGSSNSSLSIKKSPKSHNSMNISNHHVSQGRSGQIKSKPRRQSQKERKAAAKRHESDDDEGYSGQSYNGKIEITVNHLLNFKFPPREQHLQTSSHQRKKGIMSSSQPFQKEKFINAKYAVLLICEMIIDYLLN
jgi:hypothetical protein